MIIDIPVALQSLRPNAQWHMIGTEYSNIYWDDKTQTKPTEEEVNNKIEELKISEPFRLLREERNKLIAETDWTQLKDIELDIIRERNWKNYRQALRDLPSKSTPKLDSNGFLDMSSVSWPDKPSS
tara:strand:+ start:4003 stop:4380 length:378 start_codon:yes stop_codon:yes gene_type:complete